MDENGAGSGDGPPRVPPSLALERTTLSWVRTALAAIVVCVLLMRLAAVRDSAAVEVFAVAALFASAAAGLWQRYRQARRAARLADLLPHGGRLASPRSASAAAGFCVVLAVVSLALVLRP